MRVTIIAIKPASTVKRVLPPHVAPTVNSPGHSRANVISVAALIGVPQLGSLFTDGFNRGFLDPIVVGVVACVLLALLFDGVILGATRLMTPWQRAGEAST